jgi:glycosyltransferase involved in cell wall biosynthesis
MDIPILFNARFATRPASGVDRVAGELLRAMHVRYTTDAGPPRLSLAFPGRARVHEQGALAAHELADMPARLGVLRGHAWEQLELPWWDRAAWLISPCNVGPIFRHRQLAVIHDAQPFLIPGSYSFAFRATYAALLPRLARHAKILVTVSESSKRDLERTGVAPIGKAQVIPNGADHIHRILEDPDALQRHGLTAQGYILAIGSLAPHKNIAMLIDAAAGRAPGAPELIIAGVADSSVYADAGLRPGQGCRMLGRVTDRELKALYTNAIALAFPSRTEGFGLPPLEAMTCGCPVIASTADAVREVCGDAVIYAKPDEPAAWREALDAMCRNTELRARLHASGKVKAAHYTWRRAAERYYALISHASRCAST